MIFLLGVNRFSTGGCFSHIGGILCQVGRTAGGWIGGQESFYVEDEVRSPGFGSKQIAFYPALPLHIHYRRDEQAGQGHENAQRSTQ